MAFHRRGRYSVACGSHNPPSCKQDDLNFSLLFFFFFWLMVQFSGQSGNLRMCRNEKKKGVILIILLYWDSATPSSPYLSSTLPFSSSSLSFVSFSLIISYPRYYHCLLSDHLRFKSFKQPTFNWTKSSGHGSRQLKSYALL